MRIIAIDDEASPLNLMRIMLEGTEGTELVASFSNAVDALEYLRHVQVDLAFVDVEMPDMNGIDFANAVEALPNPPLIVFVTAYSQYAMDAWGTDAVAYILKPFDRAQLVRVLDRAEHMLSIAKRGGFEVRCFPRFDVLVAGKPVVFHSKRAKELLAYLVLHRGSWVDIGTLVYDLFGDIDEKSSKSHYRVILTRLRQTLSELGIEDILKTEYGKIRVDIPEENCDYYRCLRGRRSLFSGEFMQEYSWAEGESARLRAETGRHE